MSANQTDAATGRLMAAALFVAGVGWWVVVALGVLGF